MKMGNQRSALADRMEYECQTAECLLKNTKVDVPLKQIYLTAIAHAMKLLGNNNNKPE